MTTINAHITDARGVYARTVQVDPTGPQPAWAIYDRDGDALPVSLPGHTRMRIAGTWSQIPDAEIPPLPEPSVPSPGPVPQEVTMAQCRLALYDLHQIKTDEQFYALTDLLPEDKRERALLELRTRPTVRYDNQLVIAFCAAMDWDRDELFEYGALQ